MKQVKLPAGYTVEAAGVMALVFITIMVLMNQAFRIHAQTSTAFSLHEATEQKRHAVEHRSEQKITTEANIPGWNLEITAPVFRPEESLRMWSLMEEME